MYKGSTPQLRALPLSEHYSEWRRNCSLSTWLDRTIRRGYTVQFLCAPPPFSGVVETVIRSEEKVTALLSEIANLREKGAIDIVPRDQRERGFYSPYFLVPKRTGEMRPILDLRILNRCVAKRPFRMLTEAGSGNHVPVRAHVGRSRSRNVGVAAYARPSTLVCSTESRPGASPSAHADNSLYPGGGFGLLEKPSGPRTGSPVGQSVSDDAGLHGRVTDRLGGCVSGTGGRGVWPRSQRHINLLELETVQLVLTHFAPRLRGRDVLIRSDNRATVAYINRQGGVRSPVLHEAATRLWLWAHRHLRSLSAVHVPGRQNVGADLMSRGGPRDDDWRLNPEIVSLIWERFGEARADLFAARENSQCRLWFSLRAQDGPPLGTDAFAHQSWPKGLLYAFPPLSCLARLLARVKADHLTVIVVAPDLPGALWYPEMIQLLAAEPWPLPPRGDALSQALGTIERGPVISGPLKVWLLRGTD
ncbi:hypothetical protein DPEC_G00001860 [Dallia pectoralis]|uniref:Uncharacterized protein n=1 Tax=Dallia pectoralis TaxID=75939 RepID=A0ACC2HIY2_DALPE|nr:hypothetical protein DPEC_G00001860 [Dallia pectoralis]